MVLLSWLKRGERNWKDQAGQRYEEAHGSIRQVFGEHIQRRRSGPTPGTFYDGMFGTADICLAYHTMVLQYVVSIIEQHS
jgi:hypothetical protein